MNQKASTVHVKALWDTAEKGGRIVLLLFLGWSEDQADYWARREWHELTAEFSGYLVRDYDMMRTLSKR